MTVSLIHSANGPSSGEPLDGPEPGSISLENLLFPIDVDRFFAEYWENDVLVVNRDQPSYFKSFLSLDDLDAFVATGGLDGSVLSMVDAKREIAPDDYLFPTGVVDPVRAFGLFAEGATLILQQLQGRHGPLAQLCRAMEARFGYRFQTNVYFTPAGSAQGFKPHWDSHDVFVIQVAGSKSWKIYDTPMTLPDRTVHFDPKSYELGAVTRSFTLNAGDIAYVPRGVVHDAQSTDDMSLHITLGCMSTTWREVLHAAVDALSLTNPRIRQALPPGFHADGFDATGAAGIFRDIVDALGRETDVGAVLREFADDLAETRMALVPGQLAALAMLPALDAQTALRTRPDLIFRLETHDDETLGVYVFGRVLKFPLHVRPELEALLRPGPKTSATLPGDLDPDSRLVLVRRLVKEGVLTAD